MRSAGDLRMPPFQLFHLDRSEIGLAWPLARTAYPELTLEGWKRLAADLKSRGGGVLAVAAPDNILHGIATYQPVDTPDLGRVLSIGTLVAFELNSHGPVEGILRQALHRLARQLACSTLCVEMDDWSPGSYPVQPSIRSGE